MEWKEAAPPPISGAIHFLSWCYLVSNLTTDVTRLRAEECGMKTWRQEVSGLRGGQTRSIVPIFVSCVQPPKEIAHKSGREAPSGAHCTNTVTWSAPPYIWSHSELRLLEMIHHSQCKEKLICHTCSSPRVAVQLLRILSLFFPPPVIICANLFFLFV